MTLETDKETGVQYYKVNPNDIPEDWTNEPLVFDEFPFTCDEAGNKYPTSTGIPILALRDDGLFLFRDGDQYFFWWVIAGLLQRIDAPNDIAEILKAIREEKKLSVKIVNPVSITFAVSIFCINLYQNIMTLERDKETGVQYYKVDANYIPADWSNDPEEFEGFPYTNDLAGYKFPSDKGIPILAMHDDVRFLFQNGDRFYIWRAIAEHLDRIEAPNNIMAILETMKEGKRCQVTRLS